MTSEHRESVRGTALCWGCVPEVGLVELAEVAACHGFPDLSVKPGQYFRARNDPDWRERLAATSVTVGVIDGLSGYLPGSARPNDVDSDQRRYSGNLEACLEAAVDLGARTLNVTHFLGDPDIDQDQMAESVHEVAERAGEVGVRVSLEFIPGTGLPDLHTTLQVIEKAGSPAVGVMFDTWHHIRSGGSLAELAVLEGGQVFEAQISGRLTPPPTEIYVPMTGRLAPGEGDAPVAEIVRALRTVEPDLVLGVEVFTAERGEPNARVAYLAAATRAFLKQGVA